MKRRIKSGIQLENLKRYDSEFQFSAAHYPVMFNEIMYFAQLYAEQNPQAKYRILDCTFGRGGHSQGFLKTLANVHVTAFDQDQQAIDFGKENFAEQISSGKLELIHDNFASIENYNLELFDYILLDLGVSSPQLDQAERGFSFYHDGPLDMRMGQKNGLTAEFIINTYTEDDLNKMFREYGEIFKPFRVTRAICHDRKMKAFQSTHQLAGLIERVEGWKKKGQHPATQFFMALRLAVNQELEVLNNTLPNLIQLLKTNGFISVISFHSLEDRIVKNCFRGSIEGKSLHKKVITPSEDECRLNNRSRSAKLRVFTRNGVQDGLIEDDDREVEDW